jgi:hypothetical protein
MHPLPLLLPRLALAALLAAQSVLGCPLQSETNAPPLLIPAGDQLRIGVQSEELGVVELLRVAGVRVRSRDARGAERVREIPLRIREANARRAVLSSEADDEHAVLLRIERRDEEPFLRARLLDELGTRNEILELALHYEWLRGAIPAQGLPERVELSDERIAAGFAYCQDESFAALLLASPPNTRRIPRFVAQIRGATPRLEHGMRGQNVEVQEESLRLEHELHLLVRGETTHVPGHGEIRRHQRDARFALWWLDQHVAPLEQRLQSLRAELRERLPLYARGLGAGELALELDLLQREPAARQARALELLASAPAVGALFATRRAASGASWRWARNADNRFPLAEICATTSAAVRLSVSSASPWTETIRGRAAALLRFLSQEANDTGLVAEYDDQLLPQRQDADPAPLAWARAGEFAMTWADTLEPSERGASIALARRCLQALSRDPTSYLRWRSETLFLATWLALRLGSDSHDEWLVECARRQRLRPLPFRRPSQIGTIAGADSKDAAIATAIAGELFALAWQRSADLPMLEKSILALRAPLSESDGATRLPRMQRILSTLRPSFESYLAREGRRFESEFPRIGFAPSREHASRQDLEFFVTTDARSFEGSVHVVSPRGRSVLPLRRATSAASEGRRNDRLWTATLDKSMLPALGETLRCWIAYTTQRDSGEQQSRHPLEDDVLVRIGPGLFADFGDDDGRWLRAPVAARITPARNGRERALELPAGKRLRIELPLDADATIAELTLAHSGPVRLHLSRGARVLSSETGGPQLRTQRWRVPIRRPSSSAPWPIEIEAGAQGAQLAWLRASIVERGNPPPDIGRVLTPSASLPAELDILVQPLWTGEVAKLSREEIGMLLFGSGSDRIQDTPDSFAAWLDRISNARVRVTGRVRPWRVSPELPPESRSAGDPDKWQETLRELGLRDDRSEPGGEPSDALTILLFAGGAEKPRVVELPDNRRLWLVPIERDGKELTRDLGSLLMRSYAPLSIEGRKTSRGASSLLELEEQSGTPLLRRLGEIGLAASVALDPRTHPKLRLPQIGADSFGFRLNAPSAPGHVVFELEHRGAFGTGAWSQGGVLLTRLFTEDAPWLHRRGIATRMAPLGAFSRNASWVPQSPAEEIQRLLPMRAGRHDLVTDWGEIPWTLELLGSNSQQSDIQLTLRARRILPQDIDWSLWPRGSSNWIPLRPPSTQKSGRASFALQPGRKVRLGDRQALPRNGSLWRLHARRSGTGSIRLRLLTSAPHRQREIATCLWPADQTELRLSAELPAPPGDKQRWSLELQADAAVAVDLHELWLTPVAPPVLELARLAPPERRLNSADKLPGIRWQRAPALRLGAQAQDRFEIPISLPDTPTILRVATQAEVRAGPGELPRWSLTFVPSDGGRAQPLITERVPTTPRTELHLVDLTSLRGATGFLVFASQGGRQGLRLIGLSLRRQ